MTARSSAYTKAERAWMQRLVVFVYVDLWDSFVGKEDMYVRDGLHLSGKGAAVFAEGLSGAVASGLGKVRYLN